MALINILRMALVVKKTGLCRATIYNLERAGQFPGRIQITANTVGWVESEVDEWLETRIKESRKPADQEGETTA